MNNVNRSIVSIMITLIIVLSGSWAFCETGSSSRIGSAPVRQSQKWNSIEEIIAQRQLHQPRVTTAESRDGDTELLRELLEQGESDAGIRATASPVHTGMIASRQ